MASSKACPSSLIRFNLQCADGSVPAPSFDLCVARAKCCSFRVATAILRKPQKEQPAHYCLDISRIRAVATDFVPSSSVVPPDVLPSLGQVYEELVLKDSDQGHRTRLLDNGSTSSPVQTQSKN